MKFGGIVENGKSGEMVIFSRRKLRFQLKHENKLCWGLARESHVSGKALGISPFAKLFQVRFQIWKNHIFLAKHLEYRHLAKLSSLD